MMLSLLQGAQAHKLPVIATHEEEGGQILALHVLDENGLDFDFDFTADASRRGPKKKPLPDGHRSPRPSHSASARSPPERPCPARATRLPPGPAKRSSTGRASTPTRPTSSTTPRIGAELVAAVLEGERTGGGVRAQGACYSLSQAAVADQVLIRTTALNKFLGTPAGLAGRPARAAAGDGDGRSVQQLRSSRAARIRKHTRTTCSSSATAPVRRGRHADPRRGRASGSGSCCATWPAIGYALPDDGLRRCQTLAAGDLDRDAQQRRPRAAGRQRARPSTSSAPAAGWWIEPSAGCSLPARCSA